MVRDTATLEECTTRARACAEAGDEAGALEWIAKAQSALRTWFPANERRTMRAAHPRHISEVVLEALSGIPNPPIPIR
jgi:hypothetical protein